MADGLEALIAYRRKYAVYSDRLWTATDHELDRAMDERADHVAVVEGGAIAAALRLTPRSRTRFVCERFFPFTEMTQALDTNIEGLSLIDRLWVAPTHRHRRFALRMCEAALEYARQHDATHVISAVESTLRGPHAIMKRLGFARFHEHRVEDGREFGVWWVRVT